MQQKKSKAKTAPRRQKTVGDVWISISTHVDSPQPPPAVQLGGWVPFFEWLVAFEKLVKLSLFLELLKMPGKSRKHILPNWW